MIEQKHSEYLGDSVYASFDGYHIMLTTDNGYGPTNTIFLEPQVLVALENYVKRLQKDETECPSTD